MGRHALLVGLGVAGAACGGSSATSEERVDATPTTADARAVDAAAGPDAGGLGAEWLVVTGNKITYGDGKPFRGRGANLHDERSCSACSFAPAEPAGVNRWADELIDNWHATFIRFLLSAKAAPFNAFEVQWQSLTADAAYFADIKNNVAHMSAKPGVYILVTLFADPTIKDNNGDFDSEWPSSLGNSNVRYEALAEAFHDNPRVLFGLTNEPHTTAAHAPELASVYANAIAAIRAVEDRHGSPHHIVVVQAPVGWSRDLSYFVAHPLAGDQIAYEVHPYNRAADLDALITQPAKKLPLIIGEYGPAGDMTTSDIQMLWTVAQAAGVPYLAWNFHQRCPPNLLVDNASDGCGLAASTNYTFGRTAWGDLLKAHLATPWSP